MKTAATLIIAVSSLVLSTIASAEPQDSYAQATVAHLAGSSPSQAVADNPPAVTECKSVCMLPPAGVGQLAHLAQAD